MMRSFMPGAYGPASVCSQIKKDGAARRNQK
jgi:hypothetical protein